MSLAADFSVSIQQGYNPLSVVFSFTGTGTPTYYKWIFGDGGYAENVSSTTYTYNTAGVFSPVLMVSDGYTQDMITKYNYIAVNQTYVDSQNIVIESFENSGSRDWKFYVDSNMHLVFSSGINIWISNNPVINLGVWTLIEFHPGSNRMYVSTVNNGRVQIPCSLITAGLTGMNTSYQTLVCENSDMKIDELKIRSIDDNLDTYFRNLQGTVYYLK